MFCVYPPYKMFFFFFFFFDFFFFNFFFVFMVWSSCGLSDWDATGVNRVSVSSWNKTLDPESGPVYIKCIRSEQST